jgi:DNA-binding LacI/PurR family transcriptional regulator
MPYYLQIARVLRERILSGKLAEGLKLPTEAELAQSFGVSVDVVRKSQRLLAEEKLLRRIRGQGTFVAEFSSRRESKIAHIILFQNSYASSALLTSIQRGTQGLSLDVNMISCNDLEGEAKRLEAAQAEGRRIIVSSPALDAADHDNSIIYRRILAGGTPLVLVDRHVAGTGADLVWFDYETAMFDATKALLSKNLHEIVFVQPETDYRVLRARREGWQRALFGIGLDYAIHMPLDPAQNPLELGRSVLRELVARNLSPEAVVASSERLAWGIFLALQETGYEKMREKIQALTAIADAPVHDPAFNKIFSGYYRVFADLGQALEQVLEARLSGRAAAGTVLNQPVPCRALTYEEAEREFRQIRE